MIKCTIKYSSLLHKSTSVTTCTPVALLKIMTWCIGVHVVFAGKSPEDGSNGGSMTHHGIL